LPGVRVFLVAVLENEMTGIRTVKLAKCIKPNNNSNRFSVSWNKLFILDIDLD
jgi:hypothetical protein